MTKKSRRNRRGGNRVSSAKSTGKAVAPVVTKAVKQRQKRRNILFTTIAIVALVAVVAGAGYYVMAIVPYQKPIIKVNNQSINIRYLLNRILMNYNSNSNFGINIKGTMQSIANELTVQQDAPQYVGTVTDTDIDQTLRTLAKPDSTTNLTDTEFKQWYKKQLTSTRLSDKEFRNLVQISVLALRMTDYLGQTISATTSQVHLNVIKVSTLSQATAAKARIDGGESFASVAKAVSTDTTTKDNGGDMGWVPYKALAARYETVVSALDIGVCSAPVQTADPDPTSQDSSLINPPYVLFLVTEKADAKEATADQVTMMKNRAFTDWVAEQIKTKTVVYLGKSGPNYDTESASWLTYQVQKMIDAQSATALTTESTTATTESTTTPTESTTAPTTNSQP